MTYLLSLATLHAAAPGVLDVIFGHDGDFEGAPNWHPPLWDGAWAYHIGDVPDPLDGLALDLRIPSVAARLAGLCARALHPGGRVDGAWSVESLATGGKWLHGSAEREMSWAWYASGAPQSSGPRLHGIEGCSCETFLAALTLALAPRIAALRGAR